MKNMLFATLCLTLFFSCGKVKPTATVEDLVGTWQQVNANGFPLDNTQETSILTLNADGSFLATITTGIGTGAPTTTTIKGTYILTGNVMTSLLEDGTREVVAVSLTPSTLILTDQQGNYSTYRR